MASSTFAFAYRLVVRKVPKVGEVVNKIVGKRIGMKRRYAGLEDQRLQSKRAYQLTDKQRYVYQVGSAALIIFVTASLNTHPGVFERAGALSHAGYFVDPADLQLSFEELVANQEYGYLVSIGSSTQSSAIQSANRTEDAEHIVKPGEDLNSIAGWYGLGDIQTIVWANDLPNSEVTPGMRLLVPAKDGYTYKVRTGDSINKIAEMFQVEPSAITTYNKIESTQIQTNQKLFVPGATITNEVLIAATTTPEPEPTIVASNQTNTENLIASPTIDIPELQPVGPRINPVEAPSGVEISDPVQSEPVNATPVNSPLPEPKPIPQPTPTVSVSSGQGQGVAGDPIYTDSSVNDQGWVFPAPDGCIITQKYHRGHLAVDCANRGGGRMIAAQSGVVETSYCGANGYGCHVIINHENGYKTLYAHFREAPMVAVGQRIEAGQQLGWMGTTGWSTGVHLHFEIVHNGVKLNPIGPIF